MVIVNNLIQMIGSIFVPVTHSLITSWARMNGPFMRIFDGFSYNAFLRICRAKVKPRAMTAMFVFLHITTSIKLTKRPTTHSVAAEPHYCLGFLV